MKTIGRIIGQAAMTNIIMKTRMVKMKRWSILRACPLRRKRAWTLKQRHWPLRKKLLTLRQQKPWSQRDLLKRKIPGRPRGRGG